MPNFLKPFEVESSNCQRITTGGFLLVAPLICPQEEPTEVTWTLTSAYAAGDNTLNVSHDQLRTETIQADSVITVGGASFTVLETKGGSTAGDNVVVPVEPVNSAVAAGETFTLASRILKLLSPTNLPVNMTSQKEDSTDLNQGIKSSEGVVSVATSIQISAFDSTEDKALYQYIFDAADRGGEVFAMIVRSNGVTTVGRAIVSNYTNDQAVKTFSKVQFTLDFQGKYANIAPYERLGAGKQEDLNKLRAFMGLSQLSVTP